MDNLCGYGLAAVVEEHDGDDYEGPQSPKTRQLRFSRQSREALFAARDSSAAANREIRETIRQKLGVIDRVIDGKKHCSWTLAPMLLGGEGNILTQQEIAHLKRLLEPQNMRNREAFLAKVLESTTENGGDAEDFEDVIEAFMPTPTSSYSASFFSLEVSSSSPRSIKASSASSSSNNKSWRLVFQRAVNKVIVKNRITERLRILTMRGRRSSFHEEIPPDQTVAVGAILANAGSWDEFNFFDLHDRLGGRRELIANMIADEVIFHRRGSLFDSVNQGAEFMARARRLVMAITRAYEDVPYHSCLHGADTMQTLHASLVAAPAFEAALGPHTTLVALFAAYAHDVAHPGLTNFHLIDTSHAIALRFNDQSPLENLHVSTALELVRKLNVFASLEPEEAKAARSMWIEMVLATDMARHHDCLVSLERMTTTTEENNNNYASNPDNHLECLKAIMHTADLSNPSKTVNTYLRWTELVMEEFYNQADVEIAISDNKPSLPTRDTCKLDKFQLAFISFIRPLFVQIDQVQDLDFSTPLKNLDNAKAHWMRVGQGNSKNTRPPRNSSL